MKRRHKLKNNYFLLLFLIIVLTCILLNFFGKKISKNLTVYIVNDANREINHYIFETFSKDIAVNFDIDEIIRLTKNDDGEVISVDYKLDKMYAVLGDSLNRLYKNINSISYDLNIKNVDRNRKVLWVPMGIGSSNVLLANMGPKIPIRINFLVDSKMGYKTKAKNYGINNVLLELYLYIELKNTLLTPVNSKNFKENYEILLASRIINGKVPAYYNGLIENNSPVVES